MEAKLQQTLGKLVDRVFALDEPTPAALEECLGALPDGYQSLVSLFLNLRLILRWRVFGVSHANVRVESDHDAGALQLEVRVYDPESMEQPVRYGLERAGFINIGYRDMHGGMGGWVVATAPIVLIKQMQS
jgi:hypothetical protein